MTLLRGLPPLAQSDARVLVLGSMPGAASLAAERYYAHPRNLFWPLAAEVLGQALPQDYAARCRMLTEAGIALWDVLGQCRRSGSLDSAIARDSEEPNDIAGFLQAHPRIRPLFFNGAAAEQLFRRHVLPGLPDPQMLQLHRLPSSSPANAGWSTARKSAAWRELGEALRASGAR
ncbi:MAG: DNA-deoxyinosine glycosylase [Gammaproteobacteria bacterium]